jgi:hypothetical protein
MVRWTLLLLLGLLSAITPAVYADSGRGVGTPGTSVESVLRDGRQYLVFIAVDAYERWVPLRTPVRDAKALRDVLESRYYVDEIYELYDEEATKANIIKLFVELQKKIEVDDSLLVVYSGHGHLDESSSTGFWIPVNAGTDIYEQRNWLPHTQLRGLIANLAAAHVLLISDSCFAGDLIASTRSLPADVTEEYFRGAYSRVSRQVLTSGAVEAVPDESDFAGQLISVLERNRRPVIDTLMLFNEVRLGVRGSTPLMGSLPGTGHQEGASFLLFSRETAEPEELPVLGDGSAPEQLPHPSGVPEGTASSAAARPRPFSAGLALGWNIALGTYERGFRTGSSWSGRLHYHLLRDWGEIGMGVRAGYILQNGKEDSDSPFSADPPSGSSSLLAASIGYTTVRDPILYLTAELEGGAAINVFRYELPETHTTTDATPFLGSAVGVGARLADRFRITVYGRFVSFYLDQNLYMSIAPEISVEVTF